MTAQGIAGEGAPVRPCDGRLIRSALPLMVTTGLNGVLGVGYWVVAARLYDRTTVATNMAVIAAVTTLSGISQLNLGPSPASSSHAPASTAVVSSSRSRPRSRRTPSWWWAPSCWSCSHT